MRGSCNKAGGVLKDFSQKKAQLKWSLTSKGAQNKKLQAAIAPLRDWPETAALLEFAESQGVEIGFDKAMIGSGVSGDRHTNFQTGREHISLNPDADTVGLSFVLIHELRHVWQNAILGINASTTNRLEADPETAIFIERVREADAYAFTNLMITRMQDSAKDSEEVQALAKRLVESQGGKPLDPLQQQMISEYMLEKFMLRQPAQQWEMAQNFVWAIDNMQQYDRDTLLRYHEKYTSPDYLSQQKSPQPLDVPDARRMLKMGVHENVPNYLTELSDDQFRGLVLNGVEPLVKESTRLMKAFEAAAARPHGIPPQGERNFRTLIDSNVKQALAQPLPPPTKSRYTP